MGCFGYLCVRVILVVSGKGELGDYLHLVSTLLTKSFYNIPGLLLRNISFREIIVIHYPFQ